MKVTRTALPDVCLIEPTVHRDDRGAFAEVWNRRTLADMIGDVDFVQDNESRSNRGVLRGIHVQVRQPQGKLVRVTAGAVFDVAVDLRPASPLFGRWTGIELSAENRRMLWIPPGFGHGFLALTDGATVHYKVTDFYAPGAERTLAWDDPDVAVDWPFPGDCPPLLSARDREGLPLRAFADQP